METNNEVLRGPELRRDGPSRRGAGSAVRGGQPAKTESASQNRMTLHLLIMLKKTTVA